MDIIMKETGEEELSLGQGSVVVGGLEVGALSSLASLIAALEQSGNCQQYEIDLTAVPESTPRRS